LQQQYEISGTIKSCGFTDGFFFIISFKHMKHK
jgi:hypothetical protein